MEKLKNRASIIYWLEQNSIKKYSISLSGSVRVYQSVILAHQGWTYFPVDFEHVSGDFICNGNKLTSLQGAPDSVGGHFYCNDNLLTTLKGGPASVGKSFNCSNNKLENLEYAPSIIQGDFMVESNQLNSLEYFPSIISGELALTNNPGIGNYQYAKSIGEIKENLRLGQKIKAEKMVLSNMFDNLSKTNKIGGIIFGKITENKIEPQFVKKPKIYKL